MTGRLLCCEPLGNPLTSCRPGDYWPSTRGWWYGITPNGLLASLKGHAITVHEDGTVSAEPSILVRGVDETGLHDVVWHGYLRRGVWEELRSVGVGGSASA